MLRKEVHERFPTMAEALDAAAAQPLPEMHQLRDALNLLAATPETVEIRGELTLTRGEATRLTIVALDTAGRPLPDRPVDWVSETPAIATVDEEGVVYALAPGTVRVAAWCEGVAAVATMEVSAGERPVELVSPRALLRPGEQVDLDARVQGERPARVQWSSSDPRIAQVTDFGRVVALSPGAVTITASTGEHFASTTLTVSPESATAQPAVPAPSATPATPPPLPARESQAPAPASARPSRRKIVFAAAGVILLVVAAVAASLLLRGDRDPASLAAVGAGDAVPEPPAVPASQPQPAAPDPPSAAAATADSPGVAGAATARVDSGTPPPVRTQPRPPVTERTPDPVPEPEPPRTGTLRIGGLPAGAEVIVTGPDGPRTLTGGTIALVAGTYRVDVRAPGYHPARREVEVVVGQTAAWTPALEAVQPEPTPRNPAPAAEPSSAAAEVRTALSGFVDALASRDLDAIVRRYPGAGGTWRRQWSPFFENERDVRNLSTRLAEIRRVDVTGDVATAAFTVQMVYDDFRNRRQEPRFDFQATFRRGDGGWTLAELSQIR
jgi:hypothetical protein